MNPRFRIYDPISGGFCDFYSLKEAIEFYNVAKLKHSQWMFVILDPNLTMLELTTQPL